MEHVFGESSYSDIFTPENGLMLQTYVERKFDQHQDVCIRVVDAINNEASVNRWLLRVVDDDTSRNHISTKNRRKVTNYYNSLFETWQKEWQHSNTWLSSLVTNATLRTKSSL
ncbi:hypothetical protein BDD12DRAFT_861754, partial [Trichophaea hybrida]